MRQSQRMDEVELMDTAHRNLQHRYSHPELEHKTAWVRTLNPTCFASVMATGVVSLACQMIGLNPLAQALLWFNVALYAVLF